jgi:hypothetical protein
MDWFKTLIANNTFMFFFAVIGIPMLIVFGSEIIKLLIKHRERMAMIEHGMDPYAHERKSRPSKKSETDSTGPAANAASEVTK